MEFDGEQGVALGDFDGDGVDDLVVAPHARAEDRRVRIVLFAGGADFGRRPRRITLGLPLDGATTPVFLRMAALGDLDGDGVDDLGIYVRDFQATLLTVFRGRRTGFTRGREYVWLEQDM